MPETQNELYSHHVFLFPFKWLSKNNREASLSEQTKLSLLDKWFSKDEQPQWKRETYLIDKPVKYNEYNYFYDYVREVLYDTWNDDISKAPLHNAKSGAEQLLRHYRYNLADLQKHTYNIHVISRDVPYSLDIDSILLQFYDTGVGILSFHLLNRDVNQSQPEDILKINQFGRRLYPPFFNLPHNKVGTQALFSHEGWDLPGSELAKNISLQIKDQEALEETWSDYGQPSEFKENPFLLPAFISGLLPKGFLDGNESYKLVPVLDDRMFVVCWYGNDELAKALYRPAVFARRRALHEPRKKYLKHDWWYKFVFVDGGDLTCQNETMQANLIEQATNARWANYGTFYGVTDYSFVLLTGTLEHLKKPYVNAAFLVTHLQTMYYKLAELVLLQRASVQRFSEEVTHISRLPQSESQEPVSNLISSLYRQYIRFVNKIFFREVTAQVQGIELYQLLQQQCRIEKQVKDLNGEIHELHNYALQVLEGQRNKRLEQLTLLGTIFLPPSLILALYGVSIINEVSKACEVTVLYSLAVFILLTSGLSWSAYKCRNKIGKFILTVMLLAAMIGAVFSPICFTQCRDCEAKAPVSDTLPQSIENKLQQPPLPLPAVVDTTKTITNE